jgi:hypothetical protein
MLQFIVEQNVLLYVLAASCAVGVVSQLILRQLYERLMRDTKNTGEQPDSRFLQQLRQRFQYCEHLNEKVGNVQALIQKSLMEYRFWGMSLHQWKRIGVECLVISLLCALGGTAAIVQGGGSAVTGNVYLWMGALAAGLTAISYGIADTGYSRECLMVRLTDYLENSGAARDYAGFEQEYDDPYQSGNGQEQAESFHGSPSIVSVAEGRKSRRKAKAEAMTETRAQKEKRDLKDNLAKVRAGMQETAAASEREREKERGADLLRQMDPKEQERIVREVLKEFLS